MTKVNLNTEPKSKRVTRRRSLSNSDIKAIRLELVPSAYKHPWCTRDKPLRSNPVICESRRRLEIFINGKGYEEQDIALL